MKQLSKLQSTLFLIGGVLMVAGAGALYLVMRHLKMKAEAVHEKA